MLGLCYTSAPSTSINRHRPGCSGYADWEQVVSTEGEIDSVGDFEVLNAYTLQCLDSHSFLGFCQPLFGRLKPWWIPHIQEHQQQYILMFCMNICIYIYIFLTDTIYIYVCLCTLFVWVRDLRCQDCAFLWGLHKLWWHWGFQLIAVGWREGFSCRHVVCFENLVTLRFFPT